MKKGRILNITVALVTLGMFILSVSTVIDILKKKKEIAALKQDATISAPDEALATAPVNTTANSNSSSGGQGGNTTSIPGVGPYCEKPRGNSVREIMAALDYDLDAIEGKIAGTNKACGPFTDWFAINAEDAIGAGVTREEVLKRVDRLVELAKQGKFLSSFEEFLYADEGEKGIRDYMNRAINGAGRQ